MSKSSFLLFFAGFLIGMLGVNWASFDSHALMQSFQEGSFIPKMKDKFEEFRISFIANKPCYEYGNLQVMESLDNGKLWPHQKRKVRHKILDKMIKKVEAFAPPGKKQAKLKSLFDRVSALERACYGRRRV